MNQIPIYQHPFVDIFKQTKLTEWSLTQKEGDVSEIYDKELAKNVIKISGATTASNYVQIPATKHLPKKALGLIGKYVHSIIQVPSGKTYVIHFDYMVNETRLVRISISNIYTEFKNMNGNSILIPCPLQFNKWAMVQLNMHQLFEENGIFSPTSQNTFFLRSIQVTANIQIRGIFTSDIKYTVQTLPKDMQMKLGKEKDWFKQYQWVEYPQIQSNQQLQENSSKVGNQESEVNVDKAKSILKKKIAKQPSKKSVSFKGKKEENKQTLNEDLPTDEISNQDIPNEVSQYPPQRETINVQEVLNGVDGIEKTMTEIEELKQNFQYNLEYKNLNSKAQVTLYQSDQALPISKVSRVINSEEKFILKPNPIMRLDRVIGLHPHYQAGQIFYNKDEKLSKEVFYTQANLLLGYYPPFQKQRLFYDHPIQAIELLQVEPKYAFTASRGLTEEQKDLEVSIWEIEDCSCTFTFKPPLFSIHSITLSKDQEHLCFSGKDFQKRDLILVYFFKELVKFKKVEIYARQLSDFDIVNIKFNAAIANSLISVGKENIRFFKIKNSHLPAQSVILSNMGRGKVFNKSEVDFTINEKANKKTASYVFVTTTCGLLYFVNYHTRQIDQVIQIHEDKISALLFSPLRTFCVTASKNGILRIWSPNFKKLISEVNTQQPIMDVDINVNEKEIVVLSSQGTISVLDLEQSSFNVLMRSHQDHIVDMAYNKLTNKLVTVGLDSSIKIWNSETMDVQDEFTVQNDVPKRIAANQMDCMIAVGFKSGFLRVFDLEQNKLFTETMIFESPIMDVQYSPDNKFLAIFYQQSKIVIFSIEKEYQPIKTIDYDFQSGNYFSLSFSPDGKYLANISSNANNITIWETKNFSLKFHLDLTGDIISKIQFAPNGKDLVILTSSSKLKFYRISFSELKFIKDCYGLTDLECMDFFITPNNKYIVAAGKEGVVKIYDYFMRGDLVASCQAFLGHCKYPLRLACQDDMRFIYSIGEQNGIFKWVFHGDKEMPIDIGKYFEELIAEKDFNVVKEEIQNQPIFSNEELQSYTQQQIEHLKQVMNSGGFMPSKDFLSTRDIDPMTMNLMKSHQTQNLAEFQRSAQQSHQIQYNSTGYKFEQYDIELKKVLSCSLKGVKNNLVWNKDLRYIAYTSQNYVIVEDLNQEKTQRLLKEGNDQIFTLKLSFNTRYLLAFTKHGNLDGMPTIIIWDASTLKKVNQLAINDQEIMAVEFSPNSNMLLVISRSQVGEEIKGGAQFVSTISVWDFLEGLKEILCKSQLPMTVIDGRWNSYLGHSNEFVTISDRKYHYWKIANNLALQYQEGHIPKASENSASGFSHSGEFFASLEFVVPTQEMISVYLLLGLNSGYIWVLDTRVNQCLYTVKALDNGISHISTTYSRIILHGTHDTKVHCWLQGRTDMDKSDPNAFFYGREQTLTLDGFSVSTSLDESGNESMALASSGTIWYLNWVEGNGQTIKIKSCHSPQHAIQSVDCKYIPPGQFTIVQEKEEFYQFDQNYMVASSGRDGILKLWNMFDLEFQLQFIVPKEECTTLAMHQFKPFMIAAFTDGYLRFFELNQSKNLGRCKIYNDQVEEHSEGYKGIGFEQKLKEKEDNQGSENVNDYIVQMKILPSGNHILCASKNGQIILIYVQQWDPLSIRLESLASINTQVHDFDVSWLEPYNKWLVGTSNGKVIVYNRKDFNAFQQEIFNEENPPKFNFMDSFNLLDFVDNNFTESKRCNTLDHYYSISKRNLVFNEVNQENLCSAVFANTDLALYLAFIKKCNFIFIRNFELHQVSRKIELGFLPVSLSITPNSSFFAVLQLDNSIALIDVVNEENKTVVKTIHEEAKILKICPNGRYILTGGDKGDICIWSLRKQTQQIGYQ